MTKEEFIKKAKELGLSIEEIDQFIRNQEIAQNYGIDDEYSTVNFTIDKSLADEEASTTPAEHTHECNCDCECHHHERSCSDDNTCACHCHNCECEKGHCNCDHCKHN